MKGEMATLRWPGGNLALCVQALGCFRLAPLEKGEIATSPRVRAPQPSSIVSWRIAALASVPIRILLRRLAVTLQHLGTLHPPRCGRLDNPESVAATLFRGSHDSLLAGRADPMIRGEAEESLIAATP
jgi:hypothetical protein